MSVMLDADVVIDMLRKRHGAISWLQALPERPYVSGIAALEALYGAHDLAELRIIETLLSNYAILWPDESDARLARIFARQHLSHGIDILDAITAAIALRHGLTLVTFNVKHFRAIPDLQTIQPYSRA